MKHTGKNLQRSYNNILSRKSISALLIAGLLVIMLWIYSGSAFNYSDEWQMLTNIGITLVTITLVCVVQYEHARKQVEQTEAQTADVAKEMV
jgi:low affinity Fe/Cu permease